MRLRDWSPSCGEAVIRAVEAHVSGNDEAEALVWSNQIDNNVDEWRALVGTDEGIFDVRVGTRPSGMLKAQAKLVAWNDVRVGSELGADWSQSGGPTDKTVGKGIRGRNPGFRFDPSDKTEEGAAAEFLSMVTNRAPANDVLPME